MRRICLLIVSCLALCLMGCGEQKTPTYAESCWESINYSAHLEDYLAEHADSLDMEKLQSEAGNAENTLSQQFRATALLCAVEYGKQSGQYPVSAPYADAFLVNALTDEKKFWNVLSEVSSYEEFLLPVLSASRELDGDLMVKILESIPGADLQSRMVRLKLDDWIEENPIKMVQIGDGLIASGYFDDWAVSDWRKMFFYQDPHAGSMEEAVQYIAYLRNTILPIIQTGEDPALSVTASDLTGGDYFNTKMTVVIGENINLQEPEDGQDAEEIAIEGKKVAALYRNPYGEEFPGSPEPLRLLSDFMLNLPEQAYPATVEEADYYLILTPEYEYGGYYFDNDSGNDTDIRAVNSLTSIDLYEAGTGRFLRHLGNVVEESSRGIYAQRSDDTPRYPEEVKGDILYYIYSHANDPDAYAFLVDHLGDRVEFERDESIIIGQWEITYHASEVADSIRDDIFEYTPNEGARLIKAEFTITNRGLKDARFLSSDFDSREDVGVYLIDRADNVYYECINRDVFGMDLFGGDWMAPGELQTGELIYQVPEETARRTEDLSVAVFRNHQVLICPLEE